ncbi:MAG: methyltransferase domain-containing protein [Alphaproteobacteria bacterium]|nr:methyltransferase domain-containing protein [Alphaproteobacteria bacterium]
MIQKFFLALLLLVTTISCYQANLVEDSWAKDRVKVAGEILDFENEYREKATKPITAIKGAGGNVRKVHYFFTPFHYNPQSIFQINYNGKTLVGKKYISNLVIKEELPGLFCSNISEDMLLGYLERVQITQDGVIVFFSPICSEQKKKIFRDLVKDRTIDIVYPYAQLLTEKKLEKTTPIEGWVVDEKRADFLSLGEREIRLYTISLLKKIGNINGKKMFDPACSTGKFLSTLKSNFPGIYTIGQELSKQMVDYARDKLDEVYLGDSINSCVPEESVDFVFFRFLNGEVVSTEYAYKLFNSLARKCKIGGYIIVFGHTPVLVASEYFEAMGFEIIQRNGVSEDEKHIFQYYVLRKTSKGSNCTLPVSIKMPL